MRSTFIAVTLVALTATGFVLFERGVRAQDRSGDDRPPRAVAVELDPAQLRTDLEVLRRILDAKVLGRTSTHRVSAGWVAS